MLKKQNEKSALAEWACHTNAFDEASILTTHRHKKKREFIEQLHIKSASNIFNKRSRDTRSVSSIYTPILDRIQTHTNEHERNQQNSTNEFYDERYETHALHVCITCITLVVVIVRLDIKFSWVKLILHNLTPLKKKRIFVFVWASWRCGTHTYDVIIICYYYFFFLIYFLHHHNLIGQHVFYEKHWIQYAL